MDADCLIKTLTRLRIELHPSKLNDIHAGVLSHLNSLLFKYQDDLEGIVMAWDKEVKVQKTAAASIHPYFPLVHIEVKTNMLLFKPKMGSMLVGKVIKVANDFIGILVLGLFNASIPADQIRGEFKYTSSQSAWISKKRPEHRLEVGCEVKFKVSKLLSDSSIFGILGSLEDKRSTGNMAFIKESSSRESAEEPEELKEKKKDKKRQAQDDDEETAKDRGEQKKKKKKKAAKE